MYRILIYVVTAVTCAAAVAGCGVSETVVTTGIVATNAKNQVDALNNVRFHANRDVAENNVRRAVALFQADTGSLPVSLNELVEKGYLDSLPALPEGLEFTYNPFSGTIGTRKALPQEPMTVPELAPEDESWDVAEFARSLSALDQREGEAGVLDDRQRAAAGRGRSGQHRSSGVAPRRQGRAGGGYGGAGPMGEVMTGIGIQNELNSMSNAGVSSGGSYGRRAIGRSTQQHQQQQERVLRDLDL